MADPLVKTGTPGVYNPGPVQKKLGPAWTDRGRPATGYLTKRLAEDWLRTTLEHEPAVHRGMTAHPGGAPLRATVQ